MSRTLVEGNSIPVELGTTLPGPVVLGLHGTEQAKLGMSLDEREPHVWEGGRRQNLDRGCYVLNCLVQFMREKHPTHPALEFTRSLGFRVPETQSWGQASLTQRALLTNQGPRFPESNRSKKVVIGQGRKG